MGKISSADCGTLYAGGYNLLGFSTTLTWTVELGTEEAHVLGDEWVYHDSTKVKTCTVQQNGFFTDDEAGSNAAFTDIMNGEARVGGFFGMGGGGALGTIVKCFEGLMLASFEIQAERGGLAKANGSFASAGFCKDGYLLCQDADIGTGGDEAVVHSLGAATTSGGIGFLQVVNYDPDGATGLVVVIKESTHPAHAVWTTIVTFTTVTADFTSEVKEVTSVAVGTCFKVNCTWSGSPGGDQTAEVAVAFIRTPDPAP